MIVVTRLNGGPFGVNPDLIQRVDSAPDTILTLVDGSKFVVEETLGQIIRMVTDHKAEVLARSQHVAADKPRAFVLHEGGQGPDDDDPPPPVPLRSRSR